MTELLAYVEAHPWWTLIYLLVICNVVPRISFVWREKGKKP